MMDIRKIKKLIELLEESGLAEIEISEGEESVRIARFSQGTAVMTQGVAMQAPVASPGTPAVAAAPAAAAQTPAARDENLVTAPMVGTFYASPTPGAKSFVEIGQEIRVGQVLCIIEAMKMMNQIESERAGKVVAVLAKNGEPVEFGQPLFAIE
jgi:acetyl-CoA carboxylase biotin carboxyl carrier protein